MTLEDLRAAATPDDLGTLRFPPPYRQMSVSLDEANLLYALVRALKPRKVLELGTGLGLTARFIAEALVANGDDGYLLTVEPDTDLTVEAIRLLEGMPADVVKAPFGREGWADLVYIDSGVSVRENDIAHWLSGAYPGLVLIHDADRDYPGIRAGVGTYLPTANGIWVGRSRKAT